MLQKGFLTKKNKIIVSKGRFWISVIIGLLTSFGLYTFLCLFRFVFRVLDFGHANWALIIDAEDRYWQNFLFAISSLIFGNSIFILSLFKKPIKSFVRETRRSNILNNQYFLVFNYFYLFIKLILFVTILALSFAEFSLFLNPFKEIVFLVVIVLFLESWKGVIRVFKKTSYKYVLTNAVIIVLLAFSYSFTSVFDYKSYDARCQIENPYLDLPISGFTDMPIYNFKKLKIWKYNGSIKYNLEGQKANTLKELLELFDTPYIFPEYYRRNTIFILAPNDISFSEIKKIEKILFGKNIYRIKYIVKDSSGRKNRFSTEGIQKLLMFKNSQIDIFWANNRLQREKGITHPVPVISLRDKNFIDVKIQNKYYFNDSIVLKENLVEFFKDRINDSIVFHYRYNDSISYQNYITLFSAHKQAVDNLRVKDQRVERKGYEYNPINREEFEKDQRRLRQKYPLRYLENRDRSDF